METRLPRSRRGGPAREKTKTVMNVVESVRTNRFQMSDSDLATLTNIVELSIEQSFTNGFKEIEAAVKNLSERL